MHILKASLRLMVLTNISGKPIQSPFTLEMLIFLWGDPILHISGRKSADCKDEKQPQVTLGDSAVDRWQKGKRIKFQQGLKMVEKNNNCPKLVIL